MVRRCRPMQKEELQKMLQDCSSESSSPPQETCPPEPANMSHVLSPLQTRCTTGSEENPKGSGDYLFDQAISVSSAEPATTTEPSATTTTLPVEEVSLQLEDQCVYRPGFSVLSTRKFRRGFPIISGLGKVQSSGSRKRMAKGPGERKELASSDSNRGAQRSSRAGVVSSVDSPHRGLCTKRHNSALWATGVFGEWSNDSSFPQSASEAQGAPISVNPWGKSSGSPVGSRRESSGCVSDSSTMRIGSPIVASPTVSLETSVDSVKSSFGKFLFDVEGGDQVYGMNHDGVGEGDIPVKDFIPPALSPCTEMMVKLDLKEESSPSISPDLGRNISGLSTDMLHAIMGSSSQDCSDKNLESTASESSVSIDSSFDALLSNTLDDLVLLCSAPTTPAETPKSSTLISSQSNAFF